MISEDFRKHKNSHLCFYFEISIWLKWPSSHQNNLQGGVFSHVIVLGEVSSVSGGAFNCKATQISVSSVFLSLQKVLEAIEDILISVLLLFAKLLAITCNWSFSLYVYLYSSLSCAETKELERKPSSRLLWVISWVVNVCQTSEFRGKWQSCVWGFWF